MTLPNFMIIGVAKAGTTSLFRYLDQHPQVFICSEKGTNYFGYEDAIAWKWADEGAPPALRHFQAKSFEEYEALFAGVSDEIAIGEVSPQYFRCPTAAQRIHECVPDVKLVASLRNPADRAFSGFMMRTRRGEAVKGIYEELTPDSSHVKEGFYYKRLKRYLDIFPKDHIKIFLFEEFKKDPAKIIAALYEFLGVDATFVPNTSVRYNPGAVPKVRSLNRVFYNPALVTISQSVFPDSLQRILRQIRQLNLKTMPKFPPDLRADLLNLYREDILRLEELLDRDLSIWLN
jgi:sulfotransferase family protein